MEGRKEHRKKLWTIEEDKILTDHVNANGIGSWNRVAKITGLKRDGKSCRLRWKNYLSPNVIQESFTYEEDDLIMRLHRLLGNRWTLIAGRIPGRTDNQIKNHWNTYLRKKVPDDYIRHNTNKRLKETIVSAEPQITIPVATISHCSISNNTLVDIETPTLTNKLADSSLSFPWVDDDALGTREIFMDHEEFNRRASDGLLSPCDEFIDLLWDFSL